VVIAVWSVKGGVGVSSVAALLAVSQVEHAHDVVLVDLCGDLPALLGAEEERGRPGLVDWCELGDPRADALARLEHEARPGLTVIERGAGTFATDPSMLLEVLAASQRTVIVDCGVVNDHGFAYELVSRVDTSLLVTRACYLNLRAIRETDLVASGVVVLKEPGRVLGRSDIEAVAGAPVLAEIAVDQAIARSIDSGLLARRLPRRLVRVLGTVVRHAA